MAAQETNQPGSLSRITHGRTLQLRDGRRLGYAAFGAPDGTPVLFFHGIGASRLTRHPDDDLAARLGIRVVTVDRPGIGLSDPQPGRTLVGWADDVLQLADTLRLNRFAVLGWSGGGPHALACALRLPDRVTTVGLGSSAAPLHWSEAGRYRTRFWRAVARLGQIEWLVRLAMSEQRLECRRVPEFFLNRYIATLPRVDREILADPALRRIMLEANAEVYRHHSRGVADDARVLTGPWGFDPAQVTVPVYLWHGELDTIVPPAFARHLAEALPGCEATFFPAEGHFLLFARWAEILGWLVRRPASQAA